MKKKQLIFILSLVSVFIIIIIIVIAYSILSGSKINIQLDGEYLSLNHSFKDDNYTVVWECDAGTLSLTDTNSAYTAPTKNTYHVYSGINEKVKWESKDSDGFTYTTATIRAYVFKYSDNNRYTRCDGETYSDAITISNQNDKILKSDARTFGNPIRKNSDDRWQQILVLDKQKNYITLRYRYGKNLDSSEQVVWSTNVISIRNAVFDSAPVYVPGDFNINQSQFVFDTNTVCYDFLRFNNYYFDDIDADPEAYPANIVITAFVADKKAISENNLKKETYSNSTKISIKYYYGYDSYYTIDEPNFVQN